MQSQILNMPTINDIYDVNKIRNDFPILSNIIREKPLVYLDNAATTHKPTCVINRIKKFYEEENSNIHRGVHHLSQKATAEFENARTKVLRFINAERLSQIIFTKGTTESINLVARSFGSFFNEGDEIILSQMEHHSNIVPWQLIAEEKKLKIKVIPITDSGELNLNEYKKLFNPKTKFVSVVHVSNSLGTVNPIKEIIEIAHSYDVRVLIDAAQSVQHFKIDVQELDCDFLAFSGHKLYGPTGVGVLYGKHDLLEKMPPYQGGGDMISSVSFEKTTFNVLPYKFEAGTPNIAAVIGMGEAIDYISNIGIDKIAAYEKELIEYAEEKLKVINKFRIIGNAKNKCSVISFILTGIHPHDIGTILDFEGIAIRTGHHCTQPVMERYNIPATARISLGIYNTKEEIDYLAASIKKVFEVFS